EQDHSGCRRLWTKFKWCDLSSFSFFWLISLSPLARQRDSRSAQWILGFLESQGAWIRGVAGMSVLERNW
ncbi:hypothetical protein DNTS_014917, partial [Danionella cerebrum]